MKRTAEPSIGNSPHNFGCLNPSNALTLDRILRDARTGLYHVTVEEEANVVYCRIKHKELPLYMVWKLDP